MTVTAGLASTKTTAALLVTDNAQLTSEAKSALGDRIIPANSINAANCLLKTGKINLVILDLNLTQVETVKIVEDIRRQRPQIRFLVAEASGDSKAYREIIKSRFYSIAKDTNGTVTINQIERAIFMVEFLSRFWFRLTVMTACLACIIALAYISKSPVGILLGSFWITLLAIEFLVYAISSLIRMKSKN